MRSEAEKEPSFAPPLSALTPASRPTPCVRRLGCEHKLPCSWIDTQRREEARQTTTTIEMT